MLENVSFFEFWVSDTDLVIISILESKFQVMIEAMDMKEGLGKVYME